MAQDLKEKCTTEGALEGIEVDGVGIGELYTPTQISEKVASKGQTTTLAYANCQRCVFSQCNYSRT